LKSLFKKFDVGRKGCLSSDELKQVFSHCQVTVDANELYLMQSEFDPELKGVFCYELCIKSLIEKTISND
jgi:Ca2+-binding EF-hand superfamily protein